MKVLAKLSSILYHKTGENGAIKILEENQFRLSTSLGSPCDDSKTGHQWFLSCSTHKMAKGASNTGVMLVLDGSKLAQKYAGTPFDYWGPKWRNAAIKEGSYDSYDEAEERILSHDPTIPNAASFIKEIHAHWFMQEHEHYQPQTYRWHRQLTLLAKKHNIPIYWYENLHDMKLLAKSRAKKFSDFEKKPLVPAEDLKPKSWEAKSAYSTKKWLALLSIYPAKTYEDLSPKPSDFGGHLLEMSGYMSDIHNASKNKNPHELQYIYKINQQMRHMKVKTFKEYWEKLQEKLKKLTDEHWEKKQKFKTAVASKYTLKETL